MQEGSQVGKGLAREGQRSVRKRATDGYRHVNGNHEWDVVPSPFGVSPFGFVVRFRKLG